jgi:trk system potassium uptake protein TrkH
MLKNKTALILPSVTSQDVGPMSNYAGLPEISKIVLSLLMVIGRLEIMAVFILFSRSFWKL